MDEQLCMLEIRIHTWSLCILVFGVDMSRKEKCHQFPENIIAEEPWGLESQKSMSDDADTGVDVSCSKILGFDSEINWRTQIHPMSHAYEYHYTEGSIASSRDPNNCTHSEWILRYSWSAASPSWHHTLCFYLSTREYAILELLFWHVWVAANWIKWEDEM